MAFVSSFANVAQVAERDSMTEDQHDTVGLSDDAERLGGCQERWRIDQHEVEHPADGPHRVTHVHGTGRCSRVSRVGVVRGDR